MVPGHGQCGRLLQYVAHGAGLDTDSAWENEFESRGSPVMLFYEPLFLFLFFPIVFAAYLLVRRKAGARAWVLLAASLFFYLWSQPLFVPVVLASCASDYWAGRRIGRGVQRGLMLTLGIGVNLGILLYYKYAGFTVDNLDALLAWMSVAPLHFGRVALPIGVSFIVFEKISYLVDIHRGRSRPAPDFPTYLLFVFLFPKLLAGPIMKYHELEAQLLAHGSDRQGDMLAGFRRFMLGVVKKTVLADTLSGGADAAFGADPAGLSCADAWWGVLCFSFQIYIDFSAYSDMAIGLARIFGFQLRENFNKPYISRSVSEFWRRWHISLTSWIREYLYIPLGGNRVAAWRTYFNLWVCFLLSGLWHGAAWTYVAWGAYNGVFLVIERLFLLRWMERLPVVLANAVTFLITLAGWTIFRATSLGQAGLFFHAMARPFGGVADTVPHPPILLWAVGAAALISFLPRVPGFEGAARNCLADSRGRMMVNSLLALLFFFALSKALADPFKPFLYFRF
jgi:alginate O-acetyltransferase complex protein AlgI